GFWYGMGTVAQTVRTGRSAFIERHGPLYGYLTPGPAPGPGRSDPDPRRADPAEGLAVEDEAGIGEIRRMTEPARCGAWAQEMRVTFSAVLRNFVPFHA
ncbi:hypothetical protein ACWDS7_42620, partial [Streptosporangium sp. NPDC003464]